MSTAIRSALRPPPLLRMILLGDVDGRFLLLIAALGPWSDLRVAIVVLDPEQKGVLRGGGGVGSKLGELLDPNTGFTYLRARWLDPNTGRFGSRDPWGGSSFDPPSLHKYLYVRNDPLDRMDPSGEIDYTLIGQMAGLLLRSILTAMEIRDVSLAVKKVVGGEKLTRAEILSLVLIAVTGASVLGKKVLLKGSKGLLGEKFEEFLVKKLGGTGRFKAAGREFDGKIGSTRWYEARSGRALERAADDPQRLAAFKSDIGSRARIAAENNATYEIFANHPIPNAIKEWLEEKGIPYTELCE